MISSLAQSQCDITVAATCSADWQMKGQQDVQYMGFTSTKDPSVGGMVKGTGARYVQITICQTFSAGKYKALSLQYAEIVKCCGSN